MTNTPDILPTARTWQRRAWLLLGSLLIVRVLGATLMPVELVPDEAYYWDWSRSPAWCYFSKPPMVAWVIAASTHLLGTSAATVRLPAALLNTAAIASVYALGHLMFGARAGFWAALAGIAVPGSVLGGMLMTIDAPLICFWSLALLCTWQAVSSSRGAGWWTLAGLIVAAGVLSKQMMLVFPCLVLLFLLLSPQHRRHYRNPWMYLFLVLGCLALVPLARWNAAHEWLMLRHTGTHFQGNKSSFEFVTTVGHFLGTQLLMVSPILWGLLAVVGAALLGRALAALVIRRQAYDARTLYLLVFSIVPLAVVALLSFRQRILPNWPAVFYIAGGVLLAAWAQGLVPAGARLNYLRRLFVPGIALGLVCAIVLYAALPVTARKLTLGNRIISQEMDGWRELADKMQAVRVAHGDPQMPVVALHRALAAELGFYLPDRPHVYEWPMDVMVYSQYGVWQIETPPTNGWDAIVVAEAAVNRPPELFRDFSSIEQLDDIVTRGGARRFAVYVARGLRQWPRVRYHL